MTDTPTGPAITYTYADTTGQTTIANIDRVSLTDPRERAICRALLHHALRLIEAADREQSGGRP